VTAGRGGLADFEFHLATGAGDVDTGKLALGFERWANLIADWQPTFQTVVGIFRRHERGHFSSEGASTGALWAALSPAYAAWKERNYPGHPILVLRGRLQAALVDGRGPGAIEKIGPKRLEIGVDGAAIPYAAAHAKGNQRLPARPPIRFDGDVRRRGSFGAAVAQAFQRQIVDARRASLEGSSMPRHALGESPLAGPTR